MIDADINKEWFQLETEGRSGAAWQWNYRATNLRIYGN